MVNRTANYAAFYVNEPFSQYKLGAMAAKDFCYYQMLKAWKGLDNSFPFIDAHGKTYSVRDGSDWDSTLKPRLHERLRLSVNLILFLSSNTTYSRALHEELDYAINTLGLPIIVVYPELKTKEDIHGIKGFTTKVQQLWDKVPVFGNNKYKVPVLHVPMSKDIIKNALSEPCFRICTKGDTGDYHY